MFKTKYYLAVDDVSKSYICEQKVEEFSYNKNFDVFKNAIILPLKRYRDPLVNSGQPTNYGGVCDENYNFLAGYVWSENSIGNGLYEYLHAYKPENIDYINEDVIFSGDLNAHFGHFIQDSMTRLWYAAQKTESKSKIALLLSARGIWKEIDINNSYHFKLLKLLGIEKERILIIDKPTKFKSVLVPKQSAIWYGGKYNSSLLKIVYDKARESIIPKDDKKIYLSRSLWKRPLLNEAYFENYFSSRGFKIIHPQELPLEEQIAYIAGAEEIACTYGTLPHLALFAKPGIKLTCLMRFKEAISARHLIVDKLKQLDSVYIDVSFNFLPSTHSSNSIMIAPTPSWKDFLLNEYGIEDDKDIFDYLNKSEIDFGDYFKAYLHDLWNQTTFSNIYGFKFNPIIFLKSLYEALEPDGQLKMLKAIKINSNPLFKGKLFIYTRSDRNLKCTVKLLDDGRIWPVDQNSTMGAVFWSFLNGRLYFLNGGYQIVSEFVIEGVTLKRGHAKFNGVMHSKVTDTCSLETYSPGAIRNYLIKHLIKYIVNRRRYKKLKRKPDSFFRDSKNQFIRFLGKYYIRGNSTVIYYWRKKFSDYFDAHDMKHKVENLKYGMDEISCSYIDNYMRLTKYWYTSTCVGSQWTEYDIKKQKQCKEFAKTLIQPFPDILTIKPYFFFDIYGLADLPHEVLSSIDGSIIIDGGGLNGDTALVFHSHFPNSEVHVYEPLRRYVKIIYKFLSIDNCDNKIKPINKGLGEETTKTFIMGHNMSDITTIDLEYKNSESRVGLIKLDTEGMETNIIKGAENIIARDKPVLAIAMYHTPQDFFELKDKISSINHDYKFIIRKSEPSIPQADLVLIAY